MADTVHDLLNAHPKTKKPSLTLKTRIEHMKIGLHYVDIQNWKNYEQKRSRANSTPADAIKFVAKSVLEPTDKASRMTKHSQSIKT